MSRVLAALSCLALGCGGSATSPTPTPTPTPLGGPFAALCTRSISGESPFGVRLGGTFRLERAPGVFVEESFSVDAYFPEGRRPGARVVLAAATAYPPGISVASGMLDAAGNGAAIALSGHDGRQFSLAFTLDSPSDGAVVTLTRNLADPGDDTTKPAVGTGRMCPTGSVPGPVLTPRRRDFGPLTAVMLASNVPLDAGSLQPGGGLVRPEMVGVFPAPAFAPNETLPLDASGLRDILGRAVLADEPPKPLAATVPLEDLTFENQLPPGSWAIAGERSQQADGVLTIGPTWGYGVLGPYSALLALGEPGTATKVRLRHRLPCTIGDGGPIFLRLALVTARGEATNIPLTACSDAWSELTADIPGPGALWLALEHADTRGMPQFGPGIHGRPYSIDEIRFE